MAKIKAELLTSKERNICQKIAAREKGLAHKRAVALLSVDDGLTQTAAAKKSGLTLGQVRYALSIFRKNNLLPFPAETSENVAHAIATSPEVEPDKKTEKTRDEPGKQGPKKKKIRKAKKTKKAKKAKKGGTKKIEKKSKKEKGKRKKVSKKDKDKKDTKKAKKMKKAKKSKKSTKKKKS